MTSVFISGMGRSGTTLLSNLMSSGEDISVLYQPLTRVFIKCKRDYLISRGRDKYYVLNDNPYESDYVIDDFKNYLETVEIDNDFLRCCGANFDIKGCMSLFDFYCGYSFFNRVKVGAKVVGVKEIMCEEFFPYLLEKGCKVINIIRDPRDIISSINHGKGSVYFGGRKSMLFIINNWRKSVDFSINLNNVLTLRYEDVVLSTDEVLENVANFLGVDDFDFSIYKKGLLDQKGNQWIANSSHGEINNYVSNKSIGKYKGLLDHDEINYIETLCCNEFTKLGYTFDTVPSENVILNYKDKFIDSDVNLDDRYHSYDYVVKRELHRFLTNKRMMGEKSSYIAI